MDTSKQPIIRKRDGGAGLDVSSSGPPFPGRRSFLTMLISVGTIGVGALLSVQLTRFALHPLMAQTTDRSWSDVGDVEEFASIIAPALRTISIEQRDGWRKIVSEKAIYVIKGADGQPRVLSTVCPHIGCTVAWNESKGMFISPCHNGMFKPDGALISGPPRRAMDELESKIEGGRLMVRYQYFRSLVATKEVIG